MSRGIRLDSNNLSGETVHITFTADTGTTIVDYGVLTFPASLVTDYFYGTYSISAQTYEVIYTYTISQNDNLLVDDLGNYIVTDDNDYLVMSVGSLPTPTPTVSLTPTSTPQVTPTVTTTITPSVSSTPPVTPTNTVTPTVSPSQTFGETFVGDFVQGVAPTQEVMDNWVSFRQSLTGTYSQFTWSSTNGNSITVSGPEIQQLADGLRDETAVSVNIDGTNWLVGIGCTALPSIVAVELSNVSSCSASSTYALRPRIGNNNWGGTNGSTVGAPSQTITLTFS